MQNTVQSALGQLPATVQQIGITVSKNSGSFVMGSRSRRTQQEYDTLFLSNYAELNVVNDLKRVAGVSQVIIFGQRQYAMRIWLNPIKLAAAGPRRERRRRPRSRNRTRQVAAGSIGSPPEPQTSRYTYTVNALTQLSDPDAVREHHRCAPIRTAATSGSATSRGSSSAPRTTRPSLRFDGNDNVVGLGVLQYPTANALQVSQGVSRRMEQLHEAFPPGVHYDGRVRQSRPSSTNRSRKSSSRCCSSIVLVIWSSSSSCRIRGRR